MGNIALDLQIKDEDGNVYTLLTYLVNFGRLAPGIVKKVKVILVNVGFTTENIKMECVAHPTSQIGLPENTYEVADLSLDEAGPFLNVLPVPTMAPNAQVPIWVRWSMPAGVLPGAAQFGLKAEGKVIWT